MNKKTGPQSPEWIAKRTARAKGRKLSPQACANIKAGQLNRSEEDRLATAWIASINKKGKPVSEKQYAAICKAAKNRKPDSEEGKLRKKKAQQKRRREQPVSEETRTKAGISIAAWHARMRAEGKSYSKHKKHAKPKPYTRRTKTGAIQLCASS